MKIALEQLNNSVAKLKDAFEKREYKRIKVHQSCIAIETLKVAGAARSEQMVSQEE